jgi:hypothetical protein
MKWIAIAAYRAKILNNFGLDYHFDGKGCCTETFCDETGDHSQEQKSGKYT